MSSWPSLLRNSLSDNSPFLTPNFHQKINQHKVKNPSSQKKCATLSDQIKTKVAAALFRFFEESTLIQNPVTLRRPIKSTALNSARYDAEIGISASYTRIGDANAGV